MQQTMSAQLVAVTAALLVFQTPAGAEWHDQSGNLPGLTSGKSIAIWSAALGGGVVGGVLLYRKLHGRNPSEVEMPGALAFSDSRTAGLVIRNNGKMPVSISELVVQKGGYEVNPETAAPILVRAGQSIQVPVTMKSGGDGRLHVTYIESGRERTNVVKLSGKPAPYAYRQTPAVAQSQARVQ
jgi:hypothetical protein